MVLIEVANIRPTREIRTMQARARKLVVMEVIRFMALLLVVLCTTYAGKGEVATSTQIIGTLATLALGIQVLRQERLLFELGRWRDKRGEPLAGILEETLSGRIIQFTESVSKFWVLAFGAVAPVVFLYTLFVVRGPEFCAYSGMSFGLIAALILSYRMFRIAVPPPSIPWWR